jgi:hypothetical protein
MSKGVSEHKAQARAVLACNGKVLRTAGNKKKFSFMKTVLIKKHEYNIDT